LTAASFASNYADDDQPQSAMTTDVKSCFGLSSSGRHPAVAWSGLISVVIPTRNRAIMVRQAIESVLASPLIGAPAQIVLVDDDSHDETGEQARLYGVTYLRTTFRSAARSRNAGLAIARTPYVAFLDDDDLWLPGNMEHQLAELEANPGAAFSYGIAEVVTEDLKPLHQSFPRPPLPSGHVPDRFHLFYPQIGTVLFRRSALIEANGFDERVRYYEDGDLMLRIASRYGIIGVEEVGIQYRERDPSRARSDYFWHDARREVTRWRPKRLGVRWRTSLKFRIRTKGLFCWRFMDDAMACINDGSRRDAVVCLSRALRVSPVHVLRYRRRFGSVFWHCCRHVPHPHSIATSN
jgi:glycosyltransferase involved in cell wall biosynthesis